MRIDVETYAGFKNDERPVRLRLRERWLAVVDVVDRWYDPEAIYFKVLAEDGSNYILRHDERQDEWTLSAFRAP
ncbi:MAG TPA: hypothetical protein VN736_26775 [Candidatus Limnocylindrales bacterium]|nr:hypothetical protein [Candidatus Limnocylindrales bacterium]